MKAKDILLASFFMTHLPDYMIQHPEISDKELRNQIRQSIYLHAGNSKLKIYGKLSCTSGKRMKKEKRVFFQSPEEAAVQGFRPCGHCMRREYKKWKNDFI